MGGIRRVHLKFQNASGRMVFTDGDTINATATVHVSEPCKVRKVYVAIEGRAQCRWDGDGLDYTTYRGDMVYLNENVIVWQPSTPNELLTAGTHNWSFAFRFPRGLPSNCQIGCGSVSYEASAVVDIPWGFNSTHRIPFAIVKRIEVNTSQLRRSITKSAQKKLCCFCCSSNPIKLKATINKLGFCNGDNIALHLHAENHTERNLGKLYVRLVRQGVGKAGTDTNVDTTTVHVRSTEQTLGPNGKLTVASFKIPVRNLKPSVDAHVVHVKYFVEVYVQVPWGVNLHAKFDVVIGTEDSRSMDRQCAEQSVGTSLHEAGRHAHIQQAVRSKGLKEVHEPPPTYSDVMSGDAERQRLLSPMPRYS